jgi:hypothetical protein
MVGKSAADYVVHRKFAGSASAAAFAQSAAAEAYGAAASTDRTKSALVADIAQIAVEDWDYPGVQPREPHDRRVLHWRTRAADPSAVDRAIDLLLATREYATRSHETELNFPPSGRHNSHAASSAYDAVMQWIAQNGPAFELNGAPFAWRSNLPLRGRAGSP